MLEKSFGMFFFLKQPKTQGDERYVYLRLTVDGISREISTKRTWPLSRWDQAAGRPKGTKEDAAKLSAYLDVLRVQVFAAKSKLIQDQKPITADTLKNAITGKDETKHYVLATFRQHNEHMKALLNKEYAPATIQKYNTVYDHTKAFIEWKYNVDDLNIRDLNYEFITDFSFWLKTIKNCGHNVTVKYLGNFKKIVLECVRKGWLERDPFTGFKLARKDVERIPLTQDELDAIATKSFAVKRLEQVRDMFLFSCYTGLAYVDVRNLKRSQIIKGIDKELWIYTNRQKTESVTRLPLLPQALEIVNKYSEHPKCSLEGFVLPVPSNQKMNAYLKEIADIAGINKELTFHIARHTFATTVTLCNGVPFETVSKMLGHKSLAQTMIYAKIVDSKISEDMANLKRKLIAG
ncbi:MAG: site-specific integrase [Bacteroidetes bacterium]|nr:site-specific integrase [Bacteroidota bacterium]